MLYSLNEKIEEILGNEDNRDYEIAEQIQEGIEKINEETKILKEVFNSLNVIGKEKIGYNCLICNLNENTFKKIIYATFKFNKSLNSSSYDYEVINYIKNVLIEFENVEVESEYFYYEHPYLWNIIIRMVANYGYKEI